MKVKISSPWVELQFWAHLDTTTIVEGPRSLSLRGTSGERAGERGTFHRIGAANWNPLSPTLSPLLRRGEKESTSGMVVVLKDAPCSSSPLKISLRAPAETAYSAKTTRETI